MGVTLFLYFLLVGSLVMTRFEIEKEVPPDELFASFIFVVWAFCACVAVFAIMTGWFVLLSLFVTVRVGFLALHFRELQRAYRRHHREMVQGLSRCLIPIILVCVVIPNPVSRAIVLIGILTIKPMRLMHRDGIRIREYVAL